MTDVYMLWHRHRFDTSEVEEKLLGIYTNEHNGLEAIPRFATLPGFCDHPHGFDLAPKRIGNFSWENGFDGLTEGTSMRSETHLDGAVTELSKVVYVVYHEFEFPPEVDNIRFIGLFASEGDASKVIRHLLTKPGFRDHADGFTTDRYQLNLDHWDDGYITADPDEFS